MRVASLAGAILLAVTAQVLIVREAYLPAALLYAAAVLAGWWVAKVPNPGPTKPHATAPAVRPERGRGSSLLQVFLENRSALLPVPLALAAFTFLTSTDNTFTPLNVGLWGASVVTFLALFAELPRMPHLTNVRFFVAALSLLLLLGGFFYYYHLDQLPGEMTSDHAEKILDVNDVLSGKESIFFIRNTGREPLEFYLVAGFVKLTGHRLDHMALKWVTATVGLAVVPLTLFLGTVLFDQLTGLLAAAFTAINLWGIGIARMGLRFPFTPFFAALTFLFLFRALKSGRRNDYLLTGLSLGAGLYGYHAFKIAPLVLGGILLLWFLLEGRMRFVSRGAVAWSELRGWAANVSLLILLALMVFMPLLRYMVDHPESFWQRVLTRVSSEERPLPGNPVLIFADNVKNDLLMFNVQGDHSWPNTLSDVPVLDEVSGGLFVLGVAFAFSRWLVHREMNYGYVLAAILGFLLPSALAIAFPIENPSVVRAGGAIPFVMLLLALPLARLARAMPSGPVLARTALASAAVVPLILVSAQLNYQRYFVAFDHQYRANSWNSSEIAGSIQDFIHAGGRADHAWVVAYPYWVDTRNVAINLGMIQWDNVLWDVTQMSDPSSDPRPRLYILSPNDKPNADNLVKIFPAGVMTLHPSRTPGKEYVGFYVPPDTALKRVIP